MKEHKIPIVAALIGGAAGIALTAFLACTNPTPAAARPPSICKCVPFDTPRYMNVGMLCECPTMTCFAVREAGVHCQDKRPAK